MKLKYVAALSLLCAASANATSVFINEIHYDNVGGDVGEFFEVAAPTGTDLTGWSVVLYNGSNGTSYNTLDLSAGTLVDDGGYSFLAVSLPSNGLQNGSPDGLALMNGSTVVQFLSYEGSLTATNGPASGMISVDIGVSELSSTPVGFSLQLTGMGSEYSDFTWAMAAAETPNAANNLQTISGVVTFDVLINEFHADPAADLGGDANGDGTRSATEDEFVEIINTGTGDLDLSGFTLSDAVGLRHLFPAESILEPGCAVVVFGGGTPTGEFGEALVQTASTGSVGLNNGGDTIILSNGDDSIEVAYGGEGGNNQSLTRNPDVTGDTFVEHSGIAAANGALFSPGTKVDGSGFCEEDVVEEVNIVINEFQADPAGDLSGDANGDGTRDSTEDEFVEIVNVGELAANLSGWQISDAVGTRHVFPEGTMVPAGCAVVVFGGGTPTGTFGGAVVQTSSGGGLGLNNGGDSITVSNGDGSFQVVYGGEGGNNQSLTRNPDISGATFEQHSSVSEADGALFSPGTLIDGTAFSGCNVPDSAPVVLEISPSDGATTVSVDTSIEITFSENVTVSEWPALSCTISGEVALSGDVEGTSFTLTPDADLNNNETCTFTLSASSVNDTDGTPDPLASDFESAFTTAELLSCSGPSTSFIHEVQGAGDASPLVGQSVSVEGLVTQVLTGTNGFFLQEEDADADADPETSEGIFVFSSSDAALPNVGDLVCAAGQVEEFFDKTQLAATQYLVVSSDNDPVTAAIINLPFNSAAEVESLEGMYVEIGSPLTVTDNFNLGRFGDVSLSNGRLYNPTNVHAPLSQEALDLAVSNALNRILLDDDNSSQNREPVAFPTGGLSASNTLRGGDQVTQLEGALDYSFNNYRIAPAIPPTFVNANAREDAPTITRGNVTVAALNVLNLFNGDGQGGGFPTPRGADNIAEYDRQIVKTVNALNTMDADIVGLMEIENDGFGSLSTIAQLVDELNALAGEGVYDFVDAGGQIGTDAIAVGFIYKPGSVSLVGDVQLNTASIFNRPPVAQVFALENGEQLTVVVNHFKSKGGCGSATGLDADQGDGQACFNARRTEQSQTLADWLQSNEALNSQTNVLIVGDLNAYAKEDPITTLESAGYGNLIEAYQGAEAYSFSFGGEVGYLDHALASASLMEKATDAIEWHINADEPRILDYNLEFKSAQQQIDFYAPDVFRMSDHDPVMVSFDLQPDSLSGDLDGDGDVDFSDIVALSRLIRSGPVSDLSYDFNDDGEVNSLDVRALRTLCTRSRCSTRG